MYRLMTLAFGLALLAATYAFATDLTMDNIVLGGLDKVTARVQTLGGR